MDIRKTKEKIINCWSTTTRGNKTSPGDIIVIKNNGKRSIEIIKGYKWYFFVEKTDVSKSYLNELKSKNIIKEIKEGSKYIKVWFEKKQFHDKGVSSLIEDLHSKKIKTFEADIGPAKRYLLDRNFEIEDFDKINLYYFDIETDDSDGVIEYETSENGEFSSIKAKDRILSISFVDRTGKSYFLHDADEVKLLNSINKFLHEKEVDMLVGFNSKDFDIPYIWKRMQKHNINNSYIKNILHEDMQKRIQYFYSKDPEARQSLTSYSLNSLSNYFLGEGKVHREGKVIDLMNTDFQTFKEYNIKDSDLIRKLEEKLGVIELTYKMFQMCHCTPQNWSMIKAIDNFILYEANRNGIHYPTNKVYYSDVGDQDQYLGALVLDPTPGYYEDVYDLDFKSLYPNIIRTFNISPDTLTVNIPSLDHIETPGIDVEGTNKGKIYLEVEEGIIPKQIKLLLEERDHIRSKQKKLSKDSREYKDLNVKQLIVKELANSIYGVLGNPYFRGFDINIAEAITGTGQYLITLVKNHFESKGRLVIYGDTDSIFTKLNDNENINDVLMETNEMIKEHLSKNFGVRNCSIEMALDKVFSKFLIETKKKYVGLADDKLKFVGMESVKRDTIPLAKRLQEDLIKEIFRDKDEEYIKEWVSEVKREFFSQEIEVNDILIHKKMAKDARSYKGKADKKYTPPLHVRIASNLKITDEKNDISKGGSVISYIVTNNVPLEGVHISEYNGEFCREYYWNNLIYPMLERILVVVKPEVDWNQYYYLEQKVKNGNKPRRSPDDKTKREASSNGTPRRRKKSDGDL